jgi:molybdenum-dependent DNA-binding transcriptional regulator ModE
MADDKSVLLKPEHIPELSVLLDEEEDKKRRQRFRKWLSKALALNSAPPVVYETELSSLREENRRLIERLAELEEEIEVIKRSDEKREEELRRILEKKAAADHERRDLEKVRERLEQDERTAVRRNKVSVYAGIVTVFVIIAAAAPLWYGGVYRPSKEAEENALRAADKYEKANETLTEILYLHDEVQVLYERLNRLNNRLVEERAGGSEEGAIETTGELTETAAEIERVSARIEKAVPGSVSLDVLVLPTWPAGDDPARTDEVLEAKLRPRRNLVLSAYGTALMENPEIRGYVLVTAEIGRDGLVNDVDIKKTTIDASIVKDACTKTFEFTNFGKAESDTTCLFKFAFEPEG